MYTRVLDTSCCLLPVSADGSVLRFEPGCVANLLPPGLTEDSASIVVTITDSKNRVEYKLENFLSKDYRVSKEHVVFGGFKMKLSELSVHIGYKFVFEDLKEITDPVLG
jgi:hypothetical protein